MGCRIIIEYGTWPTTGWCQCVLGGCNCCGFSASCDALRTHVTVVWIHLASWKVAVLFIAPPGDKLPVARGVQGGCGRVYPQTTQSSHARHQSMHMSNYNERQLKLLWKETEINNHGWLQENELPMHHYQNFLVTKFAGAATPECGQINGINPTQIYFHHVIFFKLSYEQNNFCQIS